MIEVLELISTFFAIVVFVYFLTLHTEYKKTAKENEHLKQELSAAEAKIELYREIQSHIRIEEKTLYVDQDGRISDNDKTEATKLEMLLHAHNSVMGSKDDKI